MKDKQGFFVLTEPFVSNVSNATGVPVPAVIATAKQNVGSASNAVLFSIKISTKNEPFCEAELVITTAAVPASDAMDVDLDGASEIQYNSESPANESSFGLTSAPRPDVSFHQYAQLSDNHLAPKQSDHQYLGELSYELRRQGLVYLHERLEKMQRQVSPTYGLLLENNLLNKLTHDIESNVLHNIHSEVMSLPNPPNKDWLDQKYELGVQAEHIALGEEQTFLARVRDEEMDNAEETSIAVQVNSIDAPLTQEEVNNIQPLSAPPSLTGFPHDKRQHFMRCLFWVMKRKNDEAAAKFKERLLPSEMLPMVKEQELAVLQRISDHMQGLHRPPTPTEIEREYDTQSEHELQDCSRLECFVNRAKDFHRGTKRFFASAKAKVAGAFCISGTSSVAPAVRYASPPPPVQDVKGRFMIALKHAINNMNTDASDMWNEGQDILQLAQVDDLALKLEALMLNNLDQQHIGTPLTGQQQETLYIQAGHEMLKQIGDVDCFVQTVQACLAMPG
ncbi:unnamed protein product [Alternaria alternata]